jgi:uncharacterized DUF497 family protein
MVSVVTLTSMETTYFTWDENKRARNFAKHGLDFADVVNLDWETAVITLSPKGDQRRFKAVGYYRDGTAVVVFATLGTEAVSIISFRPARADERKVIK